MVQLARDGFALLFEHLSFTNISRDNREPSTIWRATVASAGNSSPSFRRPQTSRLCPMIRPVSPSPDAKFRTCWACSARYRSGRSNSTCCPITSLALYPKVRSAARLKTMIRPSSSVQITESAISAKTSASASAGRTGEADGTELCIASPWGATVYDFRRQESTLGSWSGAGGICLARRHSTGWSCFAL